MKKYFSIIAFIFYNLISFNSLANKPIKLAEPKSSYKILSKEGVKKHYTLNKTYIKEIFQLKPEKTNIQLELPYSKKIENFNIVKNNISNSSKLSYKINNLNNDNIGNLNITEDKCIISLNYKDKKINLESDLVSNESYNKKVFKLIEKQKPTKYFKLNKEVLKELYNSEYDDFILEMPISENRYETFYMKKNRNNFTFLSPRKDEDYSTKKHTGISYSVNLFGENIGNLSLYENNLDFNIDYLDKNVSIENLETGKLKCVSVSNNNTLDKNVKNINQLVNKFDKIKEEREKINKYKKASEKNYYEIFEEDNNLNIKIEDNPQSVDKKENKIEPIKIENKIDVINDENKIQKQEPIILNVASTDLDNLAIPIKQKLAEARQNLSNKANAPPPPPTIAFNDINCQRVLINVEVSYDHWLKMQPQNQLDLEALVKMKGRVSNSLTSNLKLDGRYFSEDMISKKIFTPNNTSVVYTEDIRNPWDTSQYFTLTQASLFPTLGYIPGPPNESQKLIKTIFYRNNRYVENKIRSYLQKAIEVFDAEGIAVGVNDIFINYQDNLKTRSTYGDKYVSGPREVSPCGPLFTKNQKCRVETDERRQSVWFNQYTGMYQKQRYPAGSIVEGFEYTIGDALKLVLSAIFVGNETMGEVLERLGILGFLKLIGSPFLVAIDILWYAYEALIDPEPYNDCVRFIVPSLDEGYFMNRNFDNIFSLAIGSIRIGQSWYNIYTPGMEDAVFDRLANVWGGKICYPRKITDTIPSQGPGQPNTIVISTPIWRYEGLHFYVGDRLPYYDNSQPNNSEFTKPYKHEQWIRAFTSTEEHGSYLDQSYAELNDRQESHPFLNDEMPTFNHENYLPMYSNMKNNFHDAMPLNNYSIQTGMHLKDIGIVIPHLATPYAAYNENNGFDLTIRGDDNVCRPSESVFNMRIGILPLLYDQSYYTIDYTKGVSDYIFSPTVSQSFPDALNGSNWNLVDHQELYGEWYEYGNTNYPPYNIDKWNQWMFVYGIAQSLGARYFTTESNPNTILSPLARNLNYNEANYKLEDGTPRISASYPYAQYRTGAYFQNSEGPNTWFEWYMDGLAQDGFFVFSDITNPLDYDMDGKAANSAFDIVVIGLQVAFSLWQSRMAYDDYIAQNSTGTGMGPNQGPAPGQSNPSIEVLRLKRSAAYRKAQAKCLTPSATTKIKAAFVGAGQLLVSLYVFGLAARHLKALYDRGYKYKFNIDNVCDGDGILTQYPDVYTEKGQTFCGPTQPDDFCGTNKPFGQKDYDTRYTYHDLGLIDGSIKKYRGFVHDTRRLYSSVDMISWGKGFDKLTGDLIRLNMTNFAVSGQNPYTDAPNGEKVHLTNHFRLEPLSEAPKHAFYGYQVPYAKMFIPTLEYVEGDTIRAFTDNLNVRQAFRPDFNRADSKAFATGGSQAPNQTPNRITYADTNMQFRWSFTNNPYSTVSPPLVSDSIRVKVAAPIYRQGNDSLYGIYPLTLYTTNTRGCQSNPATKFIKVHPKKLLPVTERFNRWYSASGHGKKALKGWDFKNVWSAGDGLADRPNNYPISNVPAERGFYLRNSFVNDPRMNSGTGWGTHENYGSTNNRNWSALAYQPVEMERGNIYSESIYFNENENIRNNNNNSNYDSRNQRLASPYKNWYSKRGAFSELTRRSFTQGLGHYNNNATPTTSKYWEGRNYQIHGSYNYWRSGTIDTARSPIYTNSDVNNDILYMKFDISSFVPSSGYSISLPIDRCVVNNCGDVGFQSALTKNVAMVDYIANSVPWEGTTQTVPINAEYICDKNTGVPNQLAGSNSRCKILDEQPFDTLFIYGRFGLSSPPVLLRKIGGFDLNTTSENYQNTTIDSYFIETDKNPMYTLRDKTAAITNYQYLKIKHVPKAQFDRNEWRTIILDLKQYDTCRTMQFNFVYKNGKGVRFDEYGDYRHYSVHSPLYIANMQVNGSFYLPLCGTDTIPKITIDSSITRCDNKAGYRLKIAAGHNAKKYQILLQSQVGLSSSPWSNPIIIKEGNINNIWSVNDTAYFPNSEVIITDTIRNLKHPYKYRLFAKIINTDSYVALDTFRTTYSGQTIVLCPPFFMSTSVLYPDSVKDTNKNYKITARFPSGHNVKTFQLFERVNPATTWTPISSVLTIPDNNFYQYEFPAFVGKPNGIFYYRLELKNPDPNCGLPITTSNTTAVASCFGCPPVFPPVISEESPPDESGNFSIKISLLRRHNLKTLELYENRQSMIYNPYTSQLGTKIQTYNLTNNQEFVTVRGFFNKRPGPYFYIIKGMDANNNPINTVYSNELRILVPETAAPYCGPISPNVYQAFPYYTLNLPPYNYLSFYLNTKCTGNKYRVIMYRLKNSLGLPFSATDSTLGLDKVALLTREGRLEKFNPLITENPNSTIPFESYETTPVVNPITGEQTAGWFSRKITPALTSYNRWYAIDIICTSCVFNNKKTLYQYFKAN
jgi:hypothetical protein